MTINRMRILELLKALQVYESLIILSFKNLVRKVITLLTCDKSVVIPPLKQETRKESIDELARRDGCQWGDSERGDGRESFHAEYLLVYERAFAACTVRANETERAVYTARRITVCEWGRPYAAGIVPLRSTMRNATRVAHFTFSSCSTGYHGENIGCIHAWRITRNRTSP